MAQVQAGLLRFSLLVFACLGFAACAGGPHPEPPGNSVVAMGTGGSHSDSQQGSGTGGMGGQQMPGTGGTNGSTAGSGGQSGAGGSNEQDAGIPAVCGHDTDDMDAGACPVGGDDDAGALH